MNDDCHDDLFGIELTTRGGACSRQELFQSSFALRSCDNDGMAKTGKRREVIGRHPTGIRPGEKSSEYQRIMLRLPDDALAELDAVARVVRRPRWRVVVDAVRTHFGTGPALSDAERRAVRQLLALR